MKKKNVDDVSIVLNCYKVKFKPRGKPDSKSLSIKDVFGTDNLNTIYQEFVKTIDKKSVFTNNNESRVLYLKETLHASKSKNLVAGVVMKGHNGPETDIDELVKGEVKKITKVSSEQYHCHPYFFLLYSRKDDARELLFIAQSYRQFGFKEVFEDAFKQFVNQYTNTNLTVQFNTLSIASLFEKYITDGKVYKLRFIKHALSKQAERVLMGDVPDKKAKYEMELSIKAPKGFFGIKQAIKYDDASFIEQVQIDGFEYEEAYADVIIGGRKRALNISRPKEFTAAYDITQQVSINGNTKLPDFDEVLKEARDVLDNDLIPNL
ncbi:MAG TPA: hypothetical protein VF622_11075 [Segetibacter sp.]